MPICEFSNAKFSRQRRPAHESVPHVWVYELNIFLLFLFDFIPIFVDFSHFFSFFCSKSTGDEENRGETTFPGKSSGNIDSTRSGGSSRTIYFILFFSKKSQKKAEKPKQQPASEEEDDAGNDKEGGMKFSGMSLDQLQNIRKSVAELTKDEFLEYIKNNSDHQIMEAQHMSSAEGRMKLFKDSERPTCTSRGPFQSNRFGALFLIPGHQ
nr:hypothetical protein Y87G2A.g - Caenorhabditis elegans [Caenorhabditis elegans]